MKVQNVKVHTRHWPKQNTFTCQIIALPELKPDEIQAGQQVAWGEGATAEEAEEDAYCILMDTLALYLSQKHT